jgi:transposase-like protein
MSQGIRKRHTAETKAAVALEAIREQKTVAQIASDFSIHSAQVSQWKGEVIANIASLFQKKRENTSEKEEENSRLYEEIGRLKIELEWLKKKSAGVRRRS